MQELAKLSPVILAFLATLFTYFLNFLGACVVLIFKNVSKKLLDGFLSMGAGIMVAASFFSLLNPAIKKANELNLIVWLVISISFILGGLLIVFADLFLNKMLEKKKNNLKRPILMFSAITLHNIPEGMAIGVAFAGLIGNNDSTILIAAIMLAVGIGIQNFPEGVATTLPLKREGLSTKKALFLGQASGIVEPIAGVLGCLFAIEITYALPFLLSFASGAMVATCVSELIPESSKSHKTLSTIFFVFGFVIMMIFDVAFG